MLMGSVCRGRLIPDNAVAVELSAPNVRPGYVKRALVSRLALRRRARVVVWDRLLMIVYQQKKVADKPTQFVVSGEILARLVLQERPVVRGLASTHLVARVV